MINYPSFAELAFSLFLLHLLYHDVQLPSQQWFHNSTARTEKTTVLFSELSLSLTEIYAFGHRRFRKI